MVLLPNSKSSLLKIAILDDYQNAVEHLSCFSLLSAFDVQIIPAAEKELGSLARQLANFDILVLTRERTKISAELLAQLPRLKLISQTGKVANHLDVDECSKYGVAVAEGIGSPVAPAELTWLLIMNTLRLVPQAIRGMLDGKWQVNIGHCIQGKTIGIWGYGKIGKRIAAYGQAFGAHIMVWGSGNSRKQAHLDGHVAAESKEVFFREADIITLHLRLNESTRSIVQAQDLQLMKPTAAIINTARAELIEPGALIESLAAGRPGFAGLDVYESEPVYDKEHPLLNMPNVVCTPHLGYVEKAGYELYFGKAFENVASFIGGTPINIKNPEVLTEKTN